jgi:mandelate racemase
MGGLTGWLEAAALCGLHSLPVSHHFFLDVTAHALCGLPRQPIGEYIPWPSPFENDARVVAGELIMGEAPGLGLTRAPGPD